MSNIRKYKVGEIRGILEGIYNDPITRRSVVPIFMSDSGMGKTYVIEEFMREKGVYKPPFVLSQRMPFEVSGMAMIDKEQDLMKYYNFDFFLDLKDGDILFIDETFNANPLTLSAFLTFLESRIMISGRKLPDIMIVAAANPQGIPVLTPQIRRRFLQYDIVFDPKSWKSFMFNKYGLLDQIADKLCNLIKSEDYSIYNYNTPADLDKAVHMIIQNIPTPYDSSVKPVLDTIIENILGDMQLADGRELKQGENIKWLDLIRLSKGITTKVETESIVNEEYSIYILDNNGDITGELKDIDEVRELYYYSPNDIVGLEKGIPISLRRIKVGGELGEIHILQKKK